MSADDAWQADNDARHLKALRVKWSPFASTLLPIADHSLAILGLPGSFLYLSGSRSFSSKITAPMRL
jgi:hypothetical protein